MQKRWKIAVIVVVALVAVAGYVAYVSSSSGGNPCAGQATAATIAFHAGVPSGAAPAAAPRAASDAGSRQAVAPTTDPGPRLAPAAGGTISVVAAENFWGSLVAQLGGNHTSVLSIVSDPNADPHEYESNTSDAVAINDAQFVIVNGVGYDQWALNLIAADNHPGQLVLNVGTLNDVSVGGGIVSGNPHMWYNPTYVNRTVAAMFSDLAAIDPGALVDFQQNYAALNASLATLYSEATSIKAHFAGAAVAATEDIFVYLANFTGLDLVSPPEFMEAVAEGNDPPAQSVVTFQCQLESGHVKMLVYNEQTVSPITESMKSIAAQHNVPIVGVTETIQPPTVSFQVWMGAQFLQLYNALNAEQLGQ